MVVVFDLFDETHLIHVFNNLRSRLGRGHPGVLAGVRHHLPVLAYHLAHGHSVTLSNLEVRKVVRRRDFDHPAPEFHVHHRIGDDDHLELAEHARDHVFFSDVFFIAGIVRMHGHRRIS